MRLTNLPTQAMEKSLDAVWLRTQVISNNIANYETPGYKAQEVSFQEVFSRANESNEKRLTGFKTTVTQNNDTTLRPDGNNVNMDKEQMELWRSYAQYSYLVDKINGQYTNLRYVIKNAMK